MTKQHVANTFNSKTIAAVDFLAAEDADAVLAVWFRMLALAVHDPEGCVRLSPGLQMNTAALADYFHCTAEAVEATVQIMEQLELLTRDETGSLQIPACAGVKRICKNKKGDIAAAISNSARRRPEEPITRNRLIPLDELPESAQNILKAWNELPLDNKFEGLYPALLARLQSLLEQYGEKAMLKAVANVAESSFLLGRSRNNRGWSISLGWMLNPEHLENILQGKYRDKTPAGSSETFQPGDEALPYSNGFYGTVVD